MLLFCYRNSEVAARCPPSELLKPGLILAWEREVAFETLRCKKSFIIALDGPFIRGKQYLMMEK